MAGDGEPANMLEIILLGAGECLLDEVSVTGAGSTNNLVSNAGFESGTNGWTFEGDHELSLVQTNGAYSGSKALHLVAGDRGDYLENRIKTNPDCTA